MKSNKFILYLLIILLLAVVCVGGYFLIKNSNESNNKIIELENQISKLENRNQINDINSDTISEKDANKENEDSTIINNSYELYAQNLKKQFSKYDTNNKNYQYVKNDIIVDGYEIFLTENGELFVNYFNENLKVKYGDYKIADNVLSFYIINEGQDVGNMLYFINENGTVGRADTEYGVANNAQIIIEKDIGYKNIVSIVNGVFGNGYSGAHGPIFIDINGNIFSVNL